MAEFGIYLPQFRPDSTEAVATAKASEKANLDGVFVLDHLWAPGTTDKRTLPIFPLLEEVAAATSTLRVGTLVAKVGLLSDDELLSAFRQLRAVLGERLIAGLGTGDALSIPEYEALGRTMAPMSERRKRLSHICRELIDEGAEVWLGGLSEALKVMASVHHATLNLWCPDDERMAEANAGSVPWTWVGNLPPEPEDAVSTLITAAQEGAEWLVLAPKGISDGQSRIDFAVECKRLMQEQAQG